MKNINAIISSGIATGAQPDSIIIKNINTYHTLITYVTGSTFSVDIIKRDVSNNLSKTSTMSIPIAVTEQNAVSLLYDNVNTITGIHHFYIVTIGQNTTTNTDDILVFHRIDLDLTTYTFNIVFLNTFRFVGSRGFVPSVPLSISVVYRLNMEKYPNQQSKVMTIISEGKRAYINGNSLIVQPGGITQTKVLSYIYTINSITNNITVTANPILDLETVYPSWSGYPTTWISGLYQKSILFYTTTTGVNKILITYIDSLSNLRMLEFSSITNSIQLNAPTKNIIVKTNILRGGIDTKRKNNRIIISYGTKVITLPDSLDLLQISNELDTGVAIPIKFASINSLWNINFKNFIIPVPSTIDLVLIMNKYFIVNGNNISMTTFTNATPTLNSLYQIQGSLYNYLNDAKSLGILQVTDGTFLSSGSLQTIDYIVSGSQFEFQQPLVSVTPAGTTVSYQYSINGGVTWTSFTVNTWISQTFTKIRFKINLTTTINTISPSIPNQSFTLSYKQ